MSAEALSIVTHSPAPLQQQEFAEYAAHLLYSTASVLNEPICHVREWYYMAQITDVLYPEASRIHQIALSALYYLGTAFSLATAVITTVPAIALRYTAVSIQPRPFMYRQGDGQEKELTDNQFSLLSWNICGVPGGYSITDGGLLSWPARINQIGNQLDVIDADVACLYEVFDTHLINLLFEKLRPRYPHFYLNIGPRSIGAPSGIFVASKYPIKDPSFIAFPKMSLIGRTKNAEKGVFAFDLLHRERSFARIFATHPQHSEEVSTPSLEERRSRDTQMQLITDAMQRTAHCTPIVTGDLNFDDNEHHNSFWANLLDWGIRNFSRPTWNGDGFCASLVGKPPSQPCNLDHTMALTGRNCTIVSRNFETGFQGDVFTRDASSDHDAVYSQITVDL